MIRTNFFYFVKDFLICKYKFFIYNHYFKRKAFIRKKLSWFAHKFIFNENNYLVTEYDYKKNKSLERLYEIKPILKSSYID